MYEGHFGLSKPPFKITPDPEFFFPGGNRGTILGALVYAISRGEGIVKVVGEVGSGKTMLCRMLERELPAECDIVYLANPRLGADEILYAIAFELGVEVALGDNKLEVLHALQQYLLDKHAHGRRVIVFIEEAQGTPVETLEEIRMLSNLETSQDKLLQIVLFGQPELDHKLDRHEIRQLRERITHGFYLEPFGLTEVRDYINLRLRASGHRGGDLFDRRALKLLAQRSRGLLRRINVLADKALLAAFATNESAVGARHVRLAAKDSEFAEHRALLGRGSLLTGAAVTAIALTAAVLWTSFAREILPLPPNSDTAAGAQAQSLPVHATLSPPAVHATAPASTGVADQIPAKRRLFDDDGHGLPTVSPATGYVGITHLRPDTRAAVKVAGEGDEQSPAGTVAGR